MSIAEILLTWLFNINQSILFSIQMPKTYTHINTKTLDYNDSCYLAKQSFVIINIQISCKNQIQSLPSRLHVYYK